MRQSVFLAHAPEHQAFASELVAFLESGCDVSCTARPVPYSSTGLLEVAEEGVSSDFLVLLLSIKSCPVQWNWPDWERRVMQEAAEMKTSILTVALDGCVFPGLLRRQNFVDAQVNKRNAMRLVKRHIRRRIFGLAGAPNLAVSPQLEALYAGLGDCPGTMTADGEEGYRFAAEAADDFDAVLTISCYRRSLAQVCGDIGQQLGLVLTGPAETNAAHIRDFLSDRRCLLLLDGFSPGLGQAIPSGRTSTVIMQAPVRMTELPDSFEYGRWLMSEQRYAEAYEIFDRLSAQDISARACRRELAWILEYWDRVDDARAIHLIDAQPGTQLTLF